MVLATQMPSIYTQSQTSSDKKFCCLHKRSQMQHMFTEGFRGLGDIDSQM